MKTPFVAQLGDVDCGPACLTAVLAAYGRHVRVSDVARACATGRDGTSAARLVRGARELGLLARPHRVAVPAPAADLVPAVTRVGLPAIVFLQAHHFVVLESISARSVRINDPSDGHRTLPLEQFASTWNGLQIALTPGPEFRPGGRPPTGPLRSWWAGEDRSARLLLLGALLLTAVASAASLLAVLLVRGLGAGAGRGLTSDTGERALAGLAVGAWVAGWAGAQLRSHLLHHTVTTRSTALVRHLLRVAPSYLQHRFSGEVAMRPQRVDGAAMQVVSLYVDGMVGILTVVAGLAGILHGSPTAFTLVLAALAADAWLIGHGLDPYREVHRRAVAEKQQRDGEIVATLTAIETLRSEASPDHLARRWAEAQQRVAALERRAHLIMLRRTRLTVLVDGASAGLVLWLSRRDDVAPHDALVLVLLAGITLSSGRRVSSLGAFDLTALQTANRLVEDVMIEPRRDGLDAPDRATPDVTLTGVSFRHPGATQALFEEVDLRLDAGRTCFVVGSSGVGKSTLARLVVGALPRTSGTIERPLHVAYVPQRALFLEGTVADNLTLGHPSRPVDLERALALVELDAVVRARGGAHRAPVTQGARNFSGGERQRLALARALLRAPDLLVLDEAFSAMDDELTDTLHARLRGLAIPILSVAHHLPTLGEGDRVVRLTRTGLTSARTDSGTTSRVREELAS